MRTTIELTDEQRAKLLDLAARRGAKGFSAIVQEALDEYLRAREDRDAEVRAARALRGTLKGKDAERLAQVGASIRSAWR